MRREGFEHVLLVPALLAAACAARPTLAWVSSQTGVASWSFVIDDGGQASELFVDGRPREAGCERAGAHLRCDLYGLFPGRHTVEVRTPGARLRGAVVIGHSLPDGGLTRDGG
jgi:hypothetical protein